MDKGYLMVGGFRTILRHLDLVLINRIVFPTYGTLEKKHLQNSQILFTKQSDFIYKTSINPVTKEENILEHMENNICKAIMRYTPCLICPGEKISFVP